MSVLTHYFVFTRFYNYVEVSLEYYFDSLKAARHLTIPYSISVHKTSFANFVFLDPFDL